MAITRVCGLPGHGMLYSAAYPFPRMPQTPGRAPVPPHAAAVLVALINGIGLPAPLQGVTGAPAQSGARGAGLAERRTAAQRPA